jgi:hypothetical protein
MEFALEKTSFHPSPEVPHPSFPEHFANHIPTIKQMDIL